MANNKTSRAYPWRLAVFLLSAILIFGATYVLYAGLNTLRRLDVVEAERDTWQRPADVVQALDLHEGNVAADLGSGAGYFTLKLSPIVGKRGQVWAVDIRKLSLAFLWIRAALRSPHNVRVIIGAEDDPHLPAGAFDAVLIANTYHELRDRKGMLDHVWRSLHPGGRLVIVDRAQDADPGHQIALPTVEAEVRANGFEIVSQRDSFIDRPGVDSWWLLVARKP